jgi:iron complex transport system substrate-binding protein
VRTLLVVSVVSLFLYSCGTRHEQKKEGYTPLRLEFAKNFKLDSCASGIRLSIGEKGGKTWNFILSEKKPSHLASDLVWIRIPVENFLTLAGTDVGMLAELKEEDRIAGVGNGKTIFSKYVKKNLRNGKIRDFNTWEQIPFEQLMQTGVNVITYSNFGKDYPHAKELEKAGIICLPILDWKEEHPLGKAEWIKLYGYLTGRSEMAKTYFSRLHTSYNNLKKEAQTYTTHPTVFCGNQTGEFWFCPSGESYEAKLIADAGGNYIYKNTKGTGSLSLPPEKVLTTNKETQIWLNPGIDTRELLHKKHPRSVFFDAFNQGNVFCYSARMNYYWENAAVAPDKVLSDLIAIFHRKNKTLHFYSKLK